MDMRFRNVTVNGVQGSDKAGNFSDSDFPIFRFIDAYLMYAECFRGAGGNGATALGMLTLRTRANGATYKCRRFNYEFHIRRES
jgi:hypothetical protein